MAGEVTTPDDVFQRMKALESLDWSFSDARTTYLTHSLHPYPAKYIPQIPRRLIEALSYKGETVADIFCGSGTTLVESLVLGRNAIGIDANPLACLISEAKTTHFIEGDEEALNTLVSRAQSLSDVISIQGQGSLFGSEPFISQASRPDHEAITFWFEPFVVEELAEILAWCQALSSDTSRKVALTIFSSIIVTVSRQDSDTRYVRREKNISPGDTLRRFAHVLKDATRAVSAFNREIEPGLTCKVYNTNILTQPDIPQVDLVVCSPPYPNAYSYHLYHMTRMVWLGMDQPKFKKEEIGSHRKYSNKGPNGATPETFRSEMAKIFAWLYDHLRTDRYACFVIGNSIIRGEKVDNADLLSEVAREHNFSEVSRIYRRMMDTKKAFNPVIGKIKGEQILILQKKAKGTV
jgi:DNA modification methylase